MESTEIRPRGRRRRIGLLAVLLLLLLVGVATLWWTHEDTRVAVAFSFAIT